MYDVSNVRIYRTILRVDFFLINFLHAMHAMVKLALVTDVFVHVSLFIYISHVMSC